MEHHRQEEENPRPTRGFVRQPPEEEASHGRTFLSLNVASSHPSSCSCSNITGSATSGCMLRCTAQRDGTNSRREKKKRLHSATRAMDKIYSGELTEGAHAKLTFS
ncbi:uncharacterized protein LOC119268693 isoform X1 [Triticum dicoccoides]|uniref:uncharacterized protein LOC119268693 isoform X1 n=1 Tax=Triticum dicoccoides TaxID=85692 RepID=UPI00188FE7CD|nr:uncharacterized protein LOC119268693 isoform X1 [Triticum dicoccoides]